MKFLGVDIGGINIDIVLFDKRFEYIGTYSTSSQLKNLKKLIRRIVLKRKIESVGIGAAVWIKEGKIVNAPNLPSLIEIDKEIDGTPILLDNDANCFALFAHGIFHLPNILAITVGTGIGGGIIANGKIYRGNGVAGELGHWFIKGRKKCKCGGLGHLECYFGGWALKKKYKMEVKELMKDKEFIYSTKEFNVFCRAIANAITFLDPSAIVFGGRIGVNLDEKKLKKEIYTYLMPSFNPEIKILPDNLAVAKGACLMAKTNKN